MTAPENLVARRRPAWRRFARGCVRGLFGVVMRIYFRELTIVGTPARDVSGRLFAANHFNGIVDPVVILGCAPYDASPIAKSTLFAMPVFSTILRIAEAVPVTRRKDSPDKATGANDAIFESVAQHLSDGGNILIFPEGVSHGDSQLLPLRSGAARMLARAHAGGARGLTVQAVALDFDARETFRSRAVVTYGPVREVDAVLGDGDEAHIHELTDRIANDLHQLVIEGGSQSELLLLRRVAELLATESGHGSLAAQDAVARQVVEHARTLGIDDPRYRAVSEAVKAYESARTAAGLTDHQVARKTGGLGPRRIVRGLALGLMAVPALLGALFYFVPYRLPRLATRMAHGELDVVSTYKLGIALVAFPLWASGLTIAAVLLTHGWLRALLVALVIVAPLCALVWIDRLDDRRGLRFLLRTSAAGRRQLDALVALRQRALAAIEAAR